MTKQALLEALKKAKGPSRSTRVAVLRTGSYLAVAIALKLAAKQALIAQEQETE